MSLHFLVLISGLELSKVLKEHDTWFTVLVNNKQNNEHVLDEYICNKIKYLNIKIYIGPAVLVLSELTRQYDVTQMLKSIHSIS